jgi:signal peptidase I
MLNKVGMALLEAIQVIGTSAILIVLLHVFVIQPQQVKGISMYPYLKDGDHLITEKVSYKFREPKRGEIIVFEFPKNRSQDYIKRIIGLPGEKIELRNGEVVVYNDQNKDGFVLQEDYLDESVITEGRAFIKEGEVIEVPSNKFLVFGDNREKSSDSRQWGFIDKTDIIGKALVRYWPPQSFQLFAAE